LDRQPLFDFDDHAALRLERRHGAFHNAIAGIRFISGNARVFAADLNPQSAPDLHANDIVQRNGLIHRAQLVKAVSSQRPNAQAEIDLREGWDGDRHGEMIVEELSF
jgi:hypothetical protein